MKSKEGWQQCPNVTELLNMIGNLPLPPAADNDAKPVVGSRPQPTPGE